MLAAMGRNKEMPTGVATGRHEAPHRGTAQGEHVSGQRPTMLAGTTQASNCSAVT